MGYSNRHAVQAKMAAMSKGPIVEIGGGKGHGVQAMRAVTHQPITVVDPYREYKDLLGGEYGPSTKAEFTANVAGLRNVVLVEQDAREVAPVPCGLLWVDLTMAYEPLSEVVSRWAPHAQMVGITGQEYGNLGTRKVADDLLRQGFERILDDQRFVACLQRPSGERAAFWICSGDDGGRYVREAAKSAESVKRHLDVPCHLFLFGETREDLAEFDAVHPLERERDYWYLDSVRAFNHAAKVLSRYDRLLYLDTDTCVCCACGDLFHLLDEYDMAMGQSPQRDAIASTVCAPPSFTTLSVGVQVFRNTDRVRAFLRAWLARYEAHATFYDENDQASLRDELYVNDAVRWTTLPPEYALRFDFGAWVVGQVRILHGRSGGISTDRVPLEEVCRRINETRKMRIWSHGRFVS